MQSINEWPYALSNAPILVPSRSSPGVQFLWTPQKLELSVLLVQNLVIHAKAHSYGSRKILKYYQGLDGNTSDEGGARSPPMQLPRT